MNKTATRIEARERGKQRANALKVQRRSESRWDRWLAATR